MARKPDTAMTYEATTQGVTVRAAPRFHSERSSPERHRYFWTYTIEIENIGTATVQLRSRCWRITDETGRIEIVEGPGVVGQTPTLKPGQSFTYTSACPLTTPSGFMAGHYRMVDADGRSFEVTIPTFSLDRPDVVRRFN